MSYLAIIINNNTSALIMDIKLNTLMKFSHIPVLEFQYIGHKLPGNLSDTAHPYENTKIEGWSTSNCSVLRSGDPTFCELLKHTIILYHNL